MRLLLLVGPSITAMTSRLSALGCCSVGTADEFSGYWHQNQDICDLADQPDKQHHAQDACPGLA